jgi:hypothetical protein
MQTRIIPLAGIEFLYLGFVSVSSLPIPICLDYVLTAVALSLLLLPV